MGTIQKDIRDSVKPDVTPAYFTKPRPAKKRYLSQSTQLSTILPASNRSIWTPVQVGSFAVGATTMQSWFKKSSRAKHVLSKIEGTPRGQRKNILLSLRTWRALRLGASHLFFDSASHYSPENFN
jgi:hypothetical protein